MKTAKRAVFFDFGDTIATTRPTYFERLTSALNSIGIEVAHDDFVRHLVSADLETYDEYKRQGNITPEEYGTWMFSSLFSALGANGGAKELLSRLRGPMREIGFTRTLVPGARELLGSLKARGYAMAVISNNDGQTAAKCEELGILGYFDTVSDSTELGLIKPGSGIFEHTLRELALSPDDAVHVGDLWGADVLGASNAGITPIWLNWRGITHLGDDRFARAGGLGEVEALIE